MKCGGIQQPHCSKNSRDNAIEQLSNHYNLFVSGVSKEPNVLDANKINELQSETLSKKALVLKKVRKFAVGNRIDMAYSNDDKIEWTLIFTSEFGRRFGLTLKQAFNYLSRYQGIDFIDRHYDYVHTQSFASMVDDIGEYCRRKGGLLA